MSWIESHQSLARHPKVFRLARLLKISKAQALGHLHLLWWWTLDYSPTGELSAYTSYDLGLAADWTGDAVAFMEALVSTGWLDKDGDKVYVHDWYDYAGRLVQERERDRERKRKARAVRPESGGSPPDGGRTADVPYPTIPNITPPPPRAREENASQEWETLVKAGKWRVLGYDDWRTLLHGRGLDESCAAELLPVVRTANWADVTRYGEARWLGWQLDDIVKRSKAIRPKSRAGRSSIT